MDNQKLRIIEPKLFKNLTRDGRYFPDQLLKKFEDGTLRVHKEDYFRYAKSNGFADSAVFYVQGRKPEHYLDAVRKLVQSRARFGWSLDEKLSRETDFIVFRSAGSNFEIPTQEAIRQARLVLKIN